MSGTNAFSVAQFLVGQNYAGVEATGTDVGDPSLSLGIPTEQFRTDYAFLAPTTYTRSYVNVTAPMGASVMLDGTPVGGFVPVVSLPRTVGADPSTGELITAQNGRYGPYINMGKESRSLENEEEKPRSID